MGQDQQWILSYLCLYLFLSLTPFVQLLVVWKGAGLLLSQIQNWNFDLMAVILRILHQIRRRIPPRSQCPVSCMNQ